MSHQGRSYRASCSKMLTEHPPPRRPAAAKAAGSDAIESWWPWPGPSGRRRHQPRPARDWRGREYKSTTDTEASLARLPRQRRAARRQDTR